MTRSHAGAHREDPLACTSFDAALCLVGLALSVRYVLGLAQLGQDAMWGAGPEAAFWIGLIGGPLAVMAPAWLLGRLSQANPVWPAIGLATPPGIWAVGLFAEPIPLALIGGAAFATVCLTIIPARHGRRVRTGARLRRGRCPDCGYDLRTDPGGLCPECGWRG